MHRIIRIMVNYVMEDVVRNLLVMTISRDVASVVVFVRRLFSIGPNVNSDEREM